MSAARTVLFLALLSVSLGSSAPAQVKRPIPTFTTDVATPRAAAGSTSRLRLTVALPAGLHVQSDTPRDPSLIATKLTLSPPPGVSVRRTSYPKATDLTQRGSAEPLAVFSGTFDVDVDVAIARSVRPGTLEIPGELRYQSCTDQVCFPPSTASVTWRVNVKGAP